MVSLERRQQGVSGPGASKQGGAPQQVRGDTRRDRQQHDHEPRGRGVPGELPLLTWGPSGGAPWLERCFRSQFRHSG